MIEKKTLDLIQDNEIESRFYYIPLIMSSTKICFIFENQ
jgi:hypothetical protein